MAEKKLKTAGTYSEGRFDFIDALRGLAAFFPRAPLARGRYT